MTFGNAIRAYRPVAGGIDRLRSPALADDSQEKAAAVKEEDGKYFDAEGNPTFKIQDDGTVDWYTFSGYRRYHSDCHVCHGPDGVGSSYAPALADSVKTLDYPNFLAIVAQGRKNVGGGKENVMPALATTRTSIATSTTSTSICARARSARFRAAGRPRRKTSRKPPRTPKRPAWGLR